MMIQSTITTKSMTFSCEEKIKDEKTISSEFYNCNLKVDRMYKKSYTEKTPNKGQNPLFDPNSINGK